MIVNKSNYKTIKYKNEYLAVGDYLIINTENDSAIGKLVAILPSGGINKYPFWPSIEVQIYLTRDEIDKEKNNLSDIDKFDSLSEYEVFKTNKNQNFFIENVSSKCNILSLEDYEKLENHSETTFFCRANYDPDKKTLDPPFDIWNKECICQNPLNPDQLYIKCDKCEKWFHPEHCGLAKMQLDEVEKFFCPKCKGRY